MLSKATELPLNLHALFVHRKPLNIVWTSVVIHIRNVNERPFFVRVPSVCSIAEESVPGTPLACEGGGFVVDDVDVETWGLNTTVSIGQWYFEIAGDGGDCMTSGGCGMAVVEGATRMDYDTGLQYIHVEVCVADGGALFECVNVTVIVDNINEGA